ncbi:hypothetical protein CLAIMM_08724 [Cladophialophora immunda]|nr:hypothetical protein CLAIMM_08724 [Cladophialophora immunda]
MDAHDTDDDNDNENVDDLGLGLGDNEDHLSDHSPDEGSDSDESKAGERSTTRGDDDDDDDDEHARAQAQLLEYLQSQLHSLTLEAETVLSRQPRSTQMALVIETKGLFDEYKHYGSMARLKVGIERFLKLGDEKGKLCFEKEGKEEGQEDEDISTDDARPSRSPSAAQPKRPAHYGEAFMLNGTEDDDKPKFDARLAFPSTRSMRDPATAAAEDSDAPPFHPLRTVDPDSVPYVTTLPWDPIATKFSWEDNKTWPKGLLANLNKILSVEDAAARERLFHHVAKYGPAPVFRVGIAEQLRSEYGSIFEPARDHYLGLTPATRAFLRDVYRRHRHLNPAERRLLALACRVAEDSVQMFWEDTADETPAYDAMRIFMAAREVERDDEARKARADTRRAEVLQAHVDRFNQEFRSPAVGADVVADSNPNANANADSASVGSREHTSDATQAPHGAGGSEEA